MPTMIKCQSLQCKILSLVIIFSSAVIVFGYIYLTSYHEKVKLQNSQYLRAYANEKTLAMINYLSIRQEVLEYFANESTGFGSHFQHMLDNKQMTIKRSEEKELDKNIKYIFEHFELYDIFLINDSGDIVYTYKKESDLGKNLNTSDLKETHFAKLFNNTRLLMQTVHSSFDYYEPSQAQALFYTTPLYYKKRYIGLLAIQIDLNTMMYGILDDISSLHEHGEVHIARMMKGHHHELIYSRSYKPFGQKEKRSLELLLDDSTIATHDYISPFDNIQGLVHYIPSMNIDLVIKADAEDIFSQFNFIRNLSIYFLIFVFFCIATLLYILYVQILSPIKKLNYATESLAKGHYDTSLSLNQNDEMSQLANNFDHMKEQIKERTQQLETQAIDLHKLLKNFDKHVIASRTNLKGILTYVSEAFCKINGFTKEELIGKPQSIGRHPDMPASFFENLWDTITEGKQWRGEIKNLTKDGDTYWVDVLISPDFDDDGKIIGYSAIRHDITAQKALQALSDSLEKTVQERTRELNKAQEIGKIGHWKIDLKDNSLTWSDEVYRIVGLHPQSMPQDYQSFLSFVHPDDKRKVNLTYWKSVRDNTPYYMMHRINQEGDGVRYVEEIGEHVTNEEGKVISSFGTIHDITELTLIQLELKEMNTNLENRVNEAISKQKQQQKYLMQQSKMAAMGEMISMIAHQWRQPLSAISLTVTNLKVTLAIGDVDMESFENKLDNISTYVQHMSLTIDDFRNFFKPDKKPEEVNIDDIIDTTLELIKLGLMRHNISINKQINSDSSLFTYKNELIQVLLNLFKNAQDNFVEKGTPQPKIDITVDEIDSEFTLVIHDNGGGIPEEYIEKIFEPYFSTKDEKNGTGLGLYMSKIIIDEHCHGSLIVKNEDGGAKFIIKLPTTVINYEI